MRRSSGVGQTKPYWQRALRGNVAVRPAVAALAVCALALGACGTAAEDDSSARAEQIENRAADERNYEAARDRDRERELEAAQTVTAVNAAADPPAEEPAGGTAGDAAAAASTGAGAASGRRLLSAADRRSFARLSSQLLGSEGIAVTTLRGTPVQTLGSLTGGTAWSTAKVPVAMAAIDAGVGSSGDLRQAITASDNAAAERLWSALGGGSRAARAATAQLRAAGDGRTTVQSQRLRPGFTAFGQTAWRLSDQARFVAGMACSAQGAGVLGLMGSVIPAQRWGLGQAGSSQRLKGGWGPGLTPGAADGWMERQMGIVTVAGRPVVIAIASGAPGHEAATISLTRLARWVVAHVDVRTAPRRAVC